MGPEPVEMPFRGLTHVVPGNHLLDEGENCTNPFASATGDKLAMRPFARFLSTLVPCLGECFELTEQGFYAVVWVNGRLYSLQKTGASCPQTFVSEQMEKEN